MSTASCYLATTAEYETYGVPFTSPAQVARASLLVDHYLRRPEGCVYGLDANGQPAYMIAKAPSLVYTTDSIIPVGKNVVVLLPGYVGDSDSLIGETVVLDRLLPSITETCIVQSVIAGQITLANVQFPHVGTTTPVVLEFGMSVLEELSLPNQRSIARLSEWPIAQLQSGLGRYGYGRRLDQTLGYFYDANLIATLSAFGGPPAWVPFFVPASSLNPQTGDLWVPAGTLLAYYTDIKVRYVGGWSQASLPPQIKIATATIIDALSAAPMGPQIRRFNAGKTQIERFADTVLDSDIKSMLRPYMANWMI